MHLATKRVGLSFEHANYTMGYGRNEPGPPAIVSTIADTGNLPDVRSALPRERFRSLTHTRHRRVGLYSAHCRF